MNILYINPGRIEAGLDAIIKGPPLSLLSIAAMVPEHNAQLFDFKVDKYHESDFRRLLQWAKVVAITSMTPQIEHALEVATMAKNQGCITILGGYHPTLDPNYVINHPAVDYCVRGEGEHTFRDLIDFIDGNKNNRQKSEISGISYRNEKAQVIHNVDRPLEPNLDIFPFPRRDLLKGKKYQYLGTKVMLMETSRGCPYNCNFCCIIKMWKDPQQKLIYRKKSLHRVMEELYSIEINRWDFVFFSDDNFTIDIKRTEKLLNLLIKSKLSRNIYFSCQSRVDTFTRNPWLAPLMEKAGFKQVFFGIESVHQQSLDKMGKLTTPDMIQTAVKMATDHGMSIFGGIIIGFPGESPEMVRENIEFTASLNLDFVQFTPITAFPGTKFFEMMEKEGKIATKHWKYYNLFHSMMKTDQMSRIEMYRLVTEAYGKYYFRKRYLLMMMKRTFLSPKFSWMRQFGFTWLKQFIFGGYGMLKSMGVTFKTLRNKSHISGVSHWEITAAKSPRERLDLFKRLVAYGKLHRIEIRSVKIQSFIHKSLKRFTLKEQNIHVKIKPAKQKIIQISPNFECLQNPK